MKSNNSTESIANNIIQNFQRNFFHKYGHNAIKLQQDFSSFVNNNEYDMKLARISNKDAFKKYY